MLGDIEDGAAAATRLAEGAPLHGTLDVADPADWLALDAGVREVAWHRREFLPEWELSAPLPADLSRLGESRIALALCHRYGRIRQEAVRQSVRYPGPLPGLAPAMPLPACPRAYGPAPAVVLPGPGRVPVFPPLSRAA
ncbi:hypothetical protein [Streptomyces sp. NPDC007100]|uniref:hypothetical protein n=1 Tax=Streptomyces sp. NPDC007100 TaxID=3155602 RepID=UPI0033C2A71B